MLYRQNTEDCFADAIGGTGLNAPDFERMLALTGPALAALREGYEDGSVALLRLPEAVDILGPAGDIAARYRESFADVVVLGTGGSSLGGRTLTAIARPGDGPRLHFMDNIDPDSFARLFAAVDPERTGFLVISKSGGTPETVTQFLICLERWRDGFGESDIASRFTVITENKSSPLRGLADELEIPLLDHDPAIDGRYSALSANGLLPAMIAGLDAQAIRDGAMRALRPILDAAAPEDCEPAKGAAINVGLAAQGISQTVLMPYVDRLADFGLWFRQLWAESLGKEGKGTTPIPALGTVDQHSQLQLYLDGPGDKLFTLIFGPIPNSDAKITTDAGYLTGKSMGELLDAEKWATADSLADHGRPVRIFELGAVDEGTLGALMMHFMAETLIAAHLLGVDPFGQPAVEAGKVLARSYLEKPRENRE